VEPVLMLPWCGRKDALPHVGGVLGDGENVPEAVNDTGVLVEDAGGLRQGLVEADDPAFEVDQAEEGRRRVHDFAHEVALALQLVEPRS
jgi:hypothetical protein